jgi:hypothetical protein
LDPEQFQITGDQVVAVGVGDHRDSYDELSWQETEEDIFAERTTLGTQPGMNWRWEKQHVRVVYQGREWLLNP